MNSEEAGHDFAPANPTDGRKVGDWKTRYSEEVAQKAIRFEAGYVLVILYLIPVLLFLIWSNAAYSLFKYINTPFNLDEYVVFKRYAYAWLGGTLGGTLFAIKWLYHSVAKNTWNQDRRLWRLFAPHLSGALAFSVVALVASGILLIFDKTEISKPSVSLPMGFLIGYFSDSATAKLTELAETLFGKSRQLKGLTTNTKAKRRRTIAKRKTINKPIDSVIAPAPIEK